MTDADFYYIYEGVGTGCTPTSNDRIGSTTDTSYVRDTSPAQIKNDVYRYKVSAVDDGGGSCTALEGPMTDTVQENCNK